MLYYIYICILYIVAQYYTNGRLLPSTTRALFETYSAMQFVELVKITSDAGLSKHLLLRTLGFHVVTTPPPKEMQLQILNEVIVASPSLLLRF